MSDTSAVPVSEEKLDFRRILPIFVIVLIDLLGLTIIIPLLPLYAVSLQASAFTIGLLGAAYPVMQFIGAPLLGRLSDRFGRKPVLVISQIGTFAGFIVLGFADALWLLFLARLIDGLSGANISTAQAAISDSTTEKTRTQGLGLIGAAFGLGFVIGPIIAFVSLAASGNNYHVPAFVAAGFSLLSILLTLFWFEETLPAERRAALAAKRSEGGQKAGAFSFGAMIRALGHPEIGLLLVLMFAQQIAFGGFEQFLSLFTLNRLGMSASDNSGLFVYVGVIVVAVQGYFVGQWAKRLGDRRLIYLGLGTLAVGLILTSLAPRQPVPWYSQERMTSELASGEMRAHENPTTESVPVPLPPDENTGWLGLAWLLVAMIPASLGGGILQPAINSLITKRVDSDEVGGTLGISAAFYSGANALAPLLMGAIFQWLGSTAPFLAGGLLLALLLGLSLMLIKPGREADMSAGLARGGAA
ncbi:MAG: MFS transporter [Anaerolineae bacterium]|nr:MFS transporter [Anaerolineae bacterium]